MAFKVTMELTFFKIADCLKSERDDRFPSWLAAKWTNMTIDVPENKVHEELNKIIFDDCAAQIAADLQRPESDILAVNTFSASQWDDHGSFHEGKAPIFASMASPPDPQEWTFVSSTGKRIHVGAHMVRTP